MKNGVKNSILIVDDKDYNLIFLKQFLDSDYIIFTATSGREAIKKAHEELPDLILLDTIMPGMSGYETLAALKYSDETKNIPVICISGVSGSEDEEKGLALDAADYISKPFSSAIVKLRVRNQIQIVNQLRAIECLSMMDQLTNISNRRSFDNRFDVEWKRANREKSPISICILDLDKFKAYNDTYGHKQGDVALYTAAQAIKQALKRPSDFVARWGGEEFVILLPDTGTNGALILAEMIRSNVESTIIPCKDGSTTRITISIGVNTQEIMPGRSTMDEFISKADKALYTAKKKGRNRVCLYDADESDDDQS